VITLLTFDLNRKKLNVKVGKTGYSVSCCLNCKTDLMEIHELRCEFLLFSLNNKHVSSLLFLFAVVLYIDFRFHSVIPIFINIFQHVKLL